MPGRAPDSSPGASKRGLTLAAIRPFDVATYIEGLQQDHSAPGVKQQLAAVRMLTDRYELPLSTASSAAREAYVQAPLIFTLTFSY